MDDALRAYLKVQPDLSAASVTAITDFILFVHQQQITHDRQPYTCPLIYPMAS